MAGDQADLVADVGRSASPSPGKTSSTPEQSVDKQSCGDESTDWQQPSAALYADQAVSIIDQAITESDRRDDPLASARYARGWLINRSRFEMDGDIDYSCARQKSINAITDGISDGVSLTWLTSDARTLNQAPVSLEREEWEDRF